MNYFDTIHAAVHAGQIGHLLPPMSERFYVLEGQRQGRTVYCTLSESVVEGFGYVPGGILLEQTLFRVLSAFCWDKQSRQWKPILPTVFEPRGSHTDLTGQ